MSVALTVNPPVANNRQPSLATRNDISKSPCAKDFFDDLLVNNSTLGSIRLIHAGLAGSILRNFHAAELVARRVREIHPPRIKIFAGNHLSDRHVDPPCSRATADSPSRDKRHRRLDMPATTRCEA
jgi:hypothetical protein